MWPPGGARRTSRPGHVRPDGRCTTVPVHAGQDVPRGTLRSVLQDAGLTVEDLLKYL
jgi:predicted RNA binding protein YcfA (HicA-like mRNA interferase family)